MVPPWGTKVHYMSGIHTNVTTVQLPSGQARYSYLRVKPQNAEMTPFMCIDDGQRFRQRDRVNEISYGAEGTAIFRAVETVPEHVLA
jgi:hypothetical protein